MLEPSSDLRDLPACAYGGRENRVGIAKQHSSPRIALAFTGQLENFSFSRRSAGSPSGSRTRSWPESSSLRTALFLVPVACRWRAKVSRAFSPRIILRRDITRRVFRVIVASLHPRRRAGARSTRDSIPLVCTDSREKAEESEREGRVEIGRRVRDGALGGFSRK